MLKGIDISKWQGDVNFTSLTSQDFIIIRSSYGTGYTDEKFERNRDGCRSKNIPHGFYHYAYPTYNSPESEADWFLAVVQPLQSGESLFLDFEESYPTPVDWSKRFLDRISSQLGGYKPLIYLNKHTVQSYDWKPVSQNGNGLWLAYWDYDPNGTFEVPHWNLVAMRQYSNNLAVSGISGRVDGNVFYGDKDQFLAYGVRLGDIPCEKLKIENEQLKSDLTSITRERDGLIGSLKDLNGLYKKLLEDGSVTNARLAVLIKTNKELVDQLKIETDKAFTQDKRIQKLEEDITTLEAEISRLKLQKYTTRESLTFLIRALKGGGK